MSKNITLTLENKTITLSVAEVDNKPLYNARDLLTGYGMNENQAHDTLRAYKQTLKTKLHDSCSLEQKGVYSFKGKSGGTYLTERALYKLAGYIDADFEDAVYEAFEAAVNGQGTKAVDIAMTVAKVHDQMAMERPCQQIRKLYKESGLSIDAFTERYLKLMDNNRQADMGDRIRTSDSLKTLVDESYDSLSARELSAASQHERALRLITEYQKERLTWSLSNQAKKERKRLDALKPVIKDGVETIISNRVQKAVADKAPF